MASLKSKMRGLRMIVLLSAAASAEFDVDSVIAQIYERPMAGLMVTPENHVNCTEESNEDPSFWEGIINDPRMRKSLVDELAQQRNSSTADIEEVLANFTTGWWHPPPPHGGPWWHPPPHGGPWWHPPPHHPWLLEEFAEQQNFSVNGMNTTLTSEWWHPWWHPPPPHWHPPPHGWGGHHHRRLRGEHSSEASASECGMSRISSECCNVEGYGEMAPSAVDAMASLLNLSTKPTKSFFDLGSGAGRLVLHMATKGYAEAATGVELNTGRHALAVDLAQRVLPEDVSLRTAVLQDAQERQKMDQKGVAFLQGDMLQANFSSASMLYLNPPCLPCDVQQMLVHKILEESNAEYVLTTTPLNGLLENGKYIEQQSELLTPMIGYSWNISVAVYRLV